MHYLYNSQEFFLRLSFVIVRRCPSKAHVSNSGPWVTFGPQCDCNCPTNSFQIVSQSVSSSGFQHLSLYSSVAMTERTGQTPDSADPEGLRLAVSQQGIMLGRQADALSQMSAAQQELFHLLDNITQTLHELTGQFSHAAAAAPQATVDLTPSAPGPSSASENIRLQPEPFLGDVETCGGFLLQCQLIFQQAPRYYQTDHSRITLIINSLRNRALHWAQAFLAANPITHLTYDRFLSEFRLIFDQPRKREEATRRLLELKQRNRLVSDHVIDFRILAVEAGWPDVALKGIFYQTLNEHIKDHLCSQPEARSFEELVSAALRSDVRLRERQKERPHTPHRSNANPPVSNKSPDEPMQIGHSKLTEEERRKWREEGACFYCGAQGHLVSSCPRRGGGPLPSVLVKTFYLFLSSFVSTFMFMILTLSLILGLNRA
uniref:CCHC-type domain-containing protein n=1 Tax=Oryzias latipes TaxID=8090 RepID=A0A3P9JSQ4_ORYLA